MAACGAPRPLHAQPAVIADATVVFPIRVDEIRIVGLARTHESVVRRELGFREGDLVTRSDFDLAVARLWNTTIFAHVHGHVVEERGKKVLVFELEDRWTLNPLLSFGSGGGAFFFRVGATDNNLAGRFVEGYALYENFDGFHGGLALFRHPRLFDRRLELAVQVERLVRPRPGFSDQRTAASIEIAQLVDRDRVRLGVRTSAFADRFLLPLDTTPMMPRATETVIVEPRVRLGRIDSERIRQRGLTFEMRPGIGLSSSDVASQLASFTGEVIAFATVGDRWWLAARARAATISRVPTHLELYAGGLDLLRGFPDNYVRTRTFTLLNLEARLVAFDSTWVALIPAAFVDAIAARSPSGAPGTALSAGGGVRIVVPKFVASGLRADLAVPIHSTLRGVSEGEPSFGPATPRVDLGSIQPSFGVYQFF